MKAFKRSATPDPNAAGAFSTTRMRTAAPLGVNRYLAVRKLLLRYLSSILVDSVLEKSLKAQKATPETLDATTLAELTGEIMIGLRLFVENDRLPQLMIELAALLDEEP
ncbi:MAG: hypothetical protein QM756_15430 [Polyangiaceae bacterium]